MRNLSAINIPGSKLEIIGRSGWMDVWIKVSAFAEDEKPYAQGRIFADSVKMPPEPRKPYSALKNIPD
jgi:hypothetical protein